MAVSDLSPGHTFDLFALPFWMLGVDPTASQQVLRDAFDRGIQTASVTDLVLAYEMLGDPARRLLHELAYPLDCPSSGVEIFYAALRADAETDDLLGFADQLQPLARANFLAHIAARRPASGQLLYEVIRSHAAIDPTSIHQGLEKTRPVAGLPAPSFLSVNQGLAELRQVHALAAFNGYNAVQDIAAPMLECTLKALASKEHHSSKTLGRFLRSYRTATEQVRTDAANLVETACAALSKRPNDLACRDTISRAAETWTSLSRPLLFWNADQPNGQLKFGTPIASLRNLIKELCTSKQYDVALDVMSACQELFAAVPTTLDELSEDARLAKTLSAYGCIKQLRKEIDHAEHDPEPLVAALEKSGFDEASVEPAKSLWNSFVAVATSTTLVATDPSPWRLIRDFAVRLSNRPNAGAAVIALLSGLIRLGERHGVSSRTLAELRDNLRFMQSFMGADSAEDSLAGNLPSKNAAPRVGKFSALVARVMRPASLLRSAWTMPLISVCVAASLAIGAVVLYSGSDLPTLWPSELSAATLAESTASLGAETMPTIGTGQHLTVEGVRYCNFQKERLRLIKQMLKRPEEARSYNLMIVDYNSRCSDFFYKDEDLKQVEAEIKANKNILEADARHILLNVPEPSADMSARK
jgi:hypothetical protein